MQSDEVEALRLNILKDATLKAFEVKSNRWHAVQAAALAVLGLGAVGFVGGGLSFLQLAGIVAFVVGLLALAGQLLAQYQEDFEERIDRILIRVERLMRRGA